MINLLPTDFKQDLLYGRRNLKLARWVGIVWAVVAGVLIIALFGQFYISQSTKKLETTLQQSQERIATQNLEKNQKDLETLNNNFKITSQLLGKQILFSDLFVQLGATIPKDSVVSQIGLTDKIAGGEGVIINIRAASNSAANQAFINISDPKNNLFDDADLLEITKVQSESSAQGGNFLDRYPYSANIQAKFKANSNFIMLNKIKAGQ